METVWLEVPNAAVMTAVWLDGIVPAVMVKLAEVEPGVTVTVGGRVRRLSLLESETVVPLPVTVRFSVTAQVVVPAEFNVVDVQLSADTVLVAITGKVTALLT